MVEKTTLSTAISHDTLAGTLGWEIDKEKKNLGAMIHRLISHKGKKSQVCFMILSTQNVEKSLDIVHGPSIGFFRKFVAG